MYKILFCLFFIYVWNLCILQKALFFSGYATVGLSRKIVLHELASYVVRFSNISI
jgi:hypothetical protein